MRLEVSKLGDVRLAGMVGDIVIRSCSFHTTHEIINFVMFPNQCQ